MLAEMFNRRIRLMVSDHLSGPETHKRIADTARANLRQLQLAKILPAMSRRFVDGFEGAPEENVRIDGGQILYVFSRGAEAVAFIIAYLEQISPAEPTGAFKGAWFIVVNGQPWTGTIADIPQDAEIIVTNYAPFLRRLEMGWRGGRGSRGHPLSGRPGVMYTELAVIAARGQFPGTKLSRIFSSIPANAPTLHGGAGWDVPYTIQRGRFAGRLMTYPSVLIEPGAVK